MICMFYDLSETELKPSNSKLSNVFKLRYRVSYIKCDAFENCKNPVFEDTGECALHCLDKIIEDEKKYLLEFSRLFKIYLLKKIKSIKVSKNNSKVLKSLCLKDLKASEFYERKDIKDIIKDSDICINHIFFPEMNFNFIIKEFNFAEFKNCLFRNCLSIDNSRNFYKFCTFNNNVRITADMEYLYKKDKKDIDYDSTENSLRENIFRYERCKFKGSVSIRGWKDGHIEINYIYYNVFKDCDFEKDIKVSGLKFREDLICISDIFEHIGFNASENYFLNVVSFYKKIYSFDNIFIEKSEFDSSFKINGIDMDYAEKEVKKYINIHSITSLKEIFIINNLKIEENKFNKKFELKNCLANNFNFEDSNTKGIFDVYKSSFIKARFYKSIFEEFAAFEYVIFGDSLIENRTDFIYVTFKDFSNFRDTYFKSGLNFSRANLKQEPNFLNTKVSTEYTDRETFRIIKNSFESVGNNLEANKFFILEMEAYSKDLFKDFDRDSKKHEILDKRYAEKFIFVSNWLISGFGRSYIRPLLLLMSSIFAYNIFYNFYEMFYKTDIYSLPRDISMISDFLNNSARGFFPFSRFVEKRKGFEFISLLFVIWFAILTWQIIVAVKRNTQH